MHVRLITLQNVKEHASLSARARFDHGVEVEDRNGHVNRAADRGYVSRLVRIGYSCMRRLIAIDPQSSMHHRYLGLDEE